MEAIAIIEWPMNYSNDNTDYPQIIFTITIKRFSWHHNLTLSLVNICLVSAGQRQGLNPRKANNEKAAKLPAKDLKKWKLTKTSKESL